MPSVTTEAEPKIPYFVTRSAEEAESRIDDARAALWAARTHLELLKKEARSDTQVELADHVLESVSAALWHLTEDETGGDCDYRSTAGQVAAMAISFDLAFDRGTTDAVLAELHRRRGGDGDDA